MQLKSLDNVAIGYKGIKTEKFEGKCYWKTSGMALREYDSRSDGI